VRDNETDTVILLRLDAARMVVVGNVVRRRLGYSAYQMTAMRRRPPTAVDEDLAHALDPRLLARGAGCLTSRPYRPGIS
jgi:hypothetical protein